MVSRCCWAGEGVLEGTCRLVGEEAERATRLTPSRPSGQHGPLRKLGHQLSSGLAGDEDLLRATLTFRMNRSASAGRLNFTTYVRPSPATARQEVYLP